MHAKPGHAQSTGWIKGWKNLLLTAFISDLHFAANEDAANELVITYLNSVSNEVLSKKDPWNYCDHEAYNELAYISAKGIDSYFYKLYCTERNDLCARKDHALNLQNRISQLEDARLESKIARSLEKNSVGKALVRTAKKMLNR